MNDLLIIGATGFTGRRLCAILDERRITFDALVRQTSDTSRIEKFASNLLVGDVTSPDELAQALNGYKRCIHIPDLSAVKDAEGYIGVFSRAKLEKVVFVSSTNMFTKLPARTKPFRKAAETAIVNSGINYVIIRPTMIYGGFDDINVSRLVKLVKRWPILPIFNGGTALQQPIFVEDHAKALVDALLSNRTDRKAYNISGASVMAYKEMLRIIGAGLGKKPLLVSLPVKPVHALACFLEKLHFPIPFRSEQFVRLIEDKNFDHRQAFEDFGFSPRSFEEGIRVGYLREVADGETSADA